MNSKHLHLVARILISLLFFTAGVRKVLAFSGTASYFANKGLPAAELVTVLVILIEIGGAAALVIGWRLREVAMGLGLFTLATAFIGHPFWSVEPAQLSDQLNNFLKNIAIAGGFLLLALQSGRPHKQA